MAPALLIRLRPRGPWRFGPGDGALDRVDTLYRSDRLYSAVTLALQRLGRLAEWLAATAATERPAVTFSSLFPFQADALFATPPATLWPPPAGLVSAPNAVFLAKIRWKTARFVPLTVIDSLMTGSRLLADQWFPDPESGCLLRRDRPSVSPFRTVLRKSAAVDRLSRTSPQATSIACTEFEPASGLWTVARFRDPSARDSWQEPVEAAFRLLGDTGFGGRRTSGWGQTHAPEFQPGNWPSLLLPKAGRTAPNTPGASGDAPASSLFWLLSLYSPGAADRVDWSAGEYELTTRAGRTENGRGSGQTKKVVQMLAEGSVIAAQAEPLGQAVNVAQDGSAHPVYRSGLALALPLPTTSGQTLEDQAVELRPVEEAGTEEAVTPPCEEVTPSQEGTAEVPSPAEPALEAPAEPPGEEPASEVILPAEETRPAIPEPATEESLPHAEEPAHPDEPAVLNETEPPAAAGDDHAL